MHGQKEHGSQVMIMSVYIIAQLTRCMNPSHHPRVILMHGRKEHGSQVMIMSVYIKGGGSIFLVVRQRILWKPMARLRATKFANLIIFTTMTSS